LRQGKCAFEVNFTAFLFTLPNKKSRLIETALHEYIKNVCDHVYLNNDRGRLGLNKGLPYINAHNSKVQTPFRFLIEHWITSLKFVSGSKVWAKKIDLASKQELLQI
jgi:hypothetical protein